MWKSKKSLSANYLKNTKMKKSKYIKILFIVLIQLFSVVSFAQMLGPSDPGNDPEGNGDDPLGGGSPIDGGTIVLVSFAVGYGAKKIYDITRHENLKVK